MKEIKKWKVRWNAGSSEELRGLENKIALLRNHASPMNTVEWRVSSFDISVKEGKNHVTLVEYNNVGCLKFDSVGKDRTKANLEFFAEVYGDFSLVYDVSINGNKYKIGTDMEYIESL